jgi:hypothetical protein
MRFSPKSKASTVVLESGERREEIGEPPSEDLAMAQKETPFSFLVSPLSFSGHAR